MSFDTKLLKETDRAVLAEMARSILSELSKIDSLRLHNFSEMNTPVGAACGYKFDGGNFIRRNLNERWNMTSILQNGITGGEESAPQNTRENLFAERLEMRRRRGTERTSAEGSLTLSDNGGSEKVFTLDGPAFCGLPEMISEMICRDARRYDGAFERY